MQMLDEKTVDQLCEAAYELGATGHRLTAGYGGVDILNAVFSHAGSDATWMQLHSRDSQRIQDSFLIAHPVY